MREALRRCGASEAALWAVGQDLVRQPKDPRLSYEGFVEFRKQFNPDRETAQSIDVLRRRMPGIRAEGLLDAMILWLAFEVRARVYTAPNSVSLCQELHAIVAGQRTNVARPYPVIARVEEFLDLLQPRIARLETDDELAFGLPLSRTRAAVSRVYSDGQRFLASCKEGFGVRQALPYVADYGVPSRGTPEGIAHEAACASITHILHAVTIANTLPPHTKSRRGATEADADTIDALIAPFVSWAAGTLFEPADLKRCRRNSPIYRKQPLDEETAG